MVGGLELNAGASLSLTGPLTVWGYLSLDAPGSAPYFYGKPLPFTHGGSSLAINGALTDNNTVDIGDEFLNANDTVTATSLVVNGFDNANLRLEGRLGGPGSLLNVASAAGFGAAGLLWGNVDLIGDATIEFASGQITSIADDGSLTLTGNDAFIADAGALTSNSALTGLSTVAGNLYLNSGATLTTAGSLTLNEGSLEVDSSGGEAFGIIGGSSLTINGAAQPQRLLWRLRLYRQQQPQCRGHGDREQHRHNERLPIRPLPERKGWWGGCVARHQVRGWFWHAGRAG